MENFKTSEIIKNNRTFIFIDNTLALNAIERKYRFYEYTGMFKLVFNNDIRFADNKDMECKNMKDYEIFVKNPQYNIHNYIITEPEYNVIINYGTYKLNVTNTLSLMIHQFYEKEKFLPKIKGIIHLEYEKI